MLRLLAVLIACFALLAAGCGGEDDRAPEAESEATATATATEEAAATPAAAAPEGCESAELPEPREVEAIDAPDEKLESGKKYVATVSTSCGDFEITLDSERAPITGGSFKYLADEKFFDDLTFHRIEPNFVIQGGDPAGTGSGGPGYSVVEAPPSDLTYDAGIVAMAKTPDEAPGTSGSQFFVVTGDGAATLPPEYALVGEVTKGMDVVTTIGAIQPDPATGALPPVVINSIRVKVS